MQFFAQTADHTSLTPDTVEPYGLDFLLTHTQLHVGSRNHHVSIYLFVVQLSM